MGETSLSSTDVRREVQSLGEHFSGNSYHIVLKNCNHFSNEFVLRLTGAKVPGWVNRLANMGSLVSCLLPKGMGVPHPESSDVQSQSTLDRYRLDSSRTYHQRQGHTPLDSYFLPRCNLRVMPSCASFCPSLSPLPHS